MRLTILIPLFAFTFVLHLAATAAVPLKWTVETSRATPAQFEAYQGETLALEAALQSYGKPLEASGIAALYWQTNGMGSAYWETTAAVNSNRLSAVWTPEMDVGAKSYNCFIGVPGTVYHAAFQLRLRPSPGADPNTLPLPVPVIDFAKVRVLNPPWEGGGGGVNTNEVERIANMAVETNAVTVGLSSSISSLQSSKADKATTYTKSEVDAKRLPNPQSLRFYSKAGTLVASYDGSAAKSVTFPTEGFAEWLSSKNPYLGENSSATGDGYSVALGVGTVASGEHSAALGAGGSRATGKNALAVGNSVEAQADNSTAIGYSSFATAKSSTAIGGNAYANGERAHAAGWAAIANGLNSTAVGNGTKVDYGAVGATAIGSGAFVGQNATNAVQIGYGTNNDPGTLQFMNKKVALTSDIPEPYTPPPYLRVYDNVRQCWWIGRMVNGVINWEVEE